MTYRHSFSSKLIILLNMFLNRKPIDSRLSISGSSVQAEEFHDELRDQV